MQEKLYQAYISSDPKRRPIFMLTEIPIKKVYEGKLYQTETSFPCGDMEYTMFFGPGGCGTLNEEIQHMEHVTVYYSESREQCLRWLKEKRAWLIDQTVQFLQELDKSIIEEN